MTYLLYNVSGQEYYLLLLDVVSYQVKFFKRSSSKRTCLFSWYICCCEVSELCTGQFDSYVYLNHCYPLLETEGGSSRADCCSLFHIHRESCTMFLSFWSSVFYCPCPGLSSLCLYLGWRPLQLFSLLGHQKAILLGGKREAAGQLGRGCTTGAVLIPNAPSSIGSEYGNNRTWIVRTQVEQSRVQINNPMI